MIQRVQSIWLLIAALLCATVFYFDQYHAHVLVNGIDTLKQIRVNDNFPSLLLALIMTVLPLVTIFLYKKRNQQKGLIIGTMIVIAGFIALMVMRKTNLEKNTPDLTNGTYWIGAVTPIIAIIFLIMAISGIRKDDKLVRSLDRLR